MGANSFRTSLQPLCHRPRPISVVHDARRRDRGSVMPPKRKRHKYGAIPTTIDGIRFASKGEAGRYKELKLLEKAKKIRDLELQPKFPLVVAGTHIAHYIADFRYFDLEAGREIIEDFKGVRTSTYRIKKKLVEVLHGIRVTEVTR